jgi:hypothetical protein
VGLVFSVHPSRAPRCSQSLQVPSLYTLLRIRGHVRGVHHDDLTRCSLRVTCPFSSRHQELGTTSSYFVCERPLAEQLSVLCILGSYHRLLGATKSPRPITSMPTYMMHPPTNWYAVDDLIAEIRYVFHLHLPCPLASPLAKRVCSQQLR